LPRQKAQIDNHQKVARMWTQKKEEEKWRRQEERRAAGRIGGVGGGQNRIGVDVIYI